MTVSDQRFVSHAQNGEDIILWRALGSVKNGFYVDVGANHPSVDSVSRSFKRLCDMEGMPGVRLHDLRHSSPPNS